MATKTSLWTFPLKSGAKRKWRRRRTLRGRVPGRATPAIVTALCGADATMLEIAQRAGMNDRYVRNIFHGDGDIMTATAIRLADAMQVDDRTLIRALAAVRRQRALRLLLEQKELDTYDRLDIMPAGQADRTAEIDSSERLTERLNESIDK